MTLKVYKPVNASTRNLSNIDRSGLWKGGPEKSLTKRLPRTGGRNAQGRVTARHRGGGAKRLYRCIDFRRQVHDVAGTVGRIEYDPIRSAFIALLEYANQGKKYVIAPESVQVGDSIGGNEVKPGSCLSLGSIPSGTKVHNIEMRPGSGAKIVRSAGTFAQVLGMDDDKIIIRLPSGQTKKFSKKCTAVIGVVSNPDHMNRSYSKAGRMRWLGWRPVVRGVAMNACSHRHGGGRGKAKGCHPVSSTGVLAKGYKTRKNPRPL